MQTKDQLFLIPHCKILKILSLNMYSPYQQIVQKSKHLTHTIIYIGIPTVIAKIQQRRFHLITYFQGHPHRTDRLFQSTSARTGNTRCRDSAIGTCKGCNTCNHLSHYRFTDCTKCLKQYLINAKHLCLDSVVIGHHATQHH